jgi:hypothetical protein
VTDVTSASDNGANSLRAAISCAANGDTIRIDLGPTDTIELMSQLVIHKDLVVINAQNGHAPIYALGAGVGLVISAGAEVHFHDLRLGGDGTSVVENEGVMHLHDCRIDASGVSGPAVLNSNHGRVYGVVRIE